MDCGGDLVLAGPRTTAAGSGDEHRRSGLGNLAERASDLGGALRVGPAEGGGTDLVWRVPSPRRRSPPLANGCRRGRQLRGAAGAPVSSGSSKTRAA